MVVTSMKACISKTNASLLASRLLAEIMHQYSPVLQAVIRNTRDFKGMSSLLCRVYQVPSALLSLCICCKCLLHESHRAAGHDG